MNRRSSFFVGLALLGLSLSAWGTGEVAQTFTLDGRLYADSAGTTPLTDSDVSVTVQVLSANQTCILYEETQPHFNAAIGNGYFTLQIGSDVGNSKRSSLDSAHAMATVYSNTSGGISGRTLGGGACTYTPSAGDVRYVRMLVTPSADGVTRTLSPNMALDSVPMATVAERAESLQGLSASQVLQVNTIGSEVLSQSNLENVFSSSNYSALTSLLSGSSNMYSKAASNGTSVLPNVSSPSTPAAGQMWYDGGSIKYYDGSSTKTLGTAGSGITSLTIGAGLTPTGTISSSGSIAVDVGTTAGKILQVDTGDKLPAIDGSALTNLNGSAVNSGTIGGTTAVNTSGNITTTGDVSANDISASGNADITGNVVASGNGSFAAVSSKQLSLYDDATTNTNYVTLKTPATGTLTSDYTLTLPPALPGVSGQVLTSDTSGVLSWSSPSTGSVTSVTSSGAPIVIGGTASAPTVGVNAASTAASGVVQLAASGGTTAGTVVQANDTRLSDSRAPSGGASGDLAGSYPSPTVAGIQGKTVTYTTLTTGDHLKYDGSGWVNAALSSADLSNESDLLKVSNMPANCSAGSSLTFSSPSGTWVCSSIPDATASSKGIMQVGSGLSVSSGTVSLDLSSSDVTTALGYTPVNKAGDTMTGALGLASYTNTTEATLVGGLAAGDKGKTWFNSDILQIRMWDGTQVVDVAAATAPTSSEDGMSLRWNDTAKAWQYFTAGAAGSGIGTLNGLTATSQNFAIGTSGTAPAFSSTTATHTLNIPMASASSVTAGLISKTDYDNFTNKLGTSSTFSGDVSGTSSTTSVDKIKGKTVTYTSITSGDFLKYDGSGWVNAALSLSSSDLSDASSLIKSTQMPASCGADHTLTFSSPTGTWSCTSIAIDAAAITSGTIDAARLPAEAKYWQAATGGIHYSSGNVGIGTTAPAYPLTVSGNQNSALGLAVNNTNAGTAAESNIFIGNDFTSTWQAGALTYRGPGFTASGTANPNQFEIVSWAGATNGLLIGSDGSAPVKFMSDGTERMRILAGGNVGIGTASPTAQLEIGTTTGAVPFFINNGADTSVSTPLMVLRSGQGGGSYSRQPAMAFAGPWSVSNPTEYYATIRAYNDNGGPGASASSSLRFATAAGDPAVLSDKMTITGDGKVGIGTASPSEALEVNGNIKGTQLCIGNDCRSAWPGSGGGGTVTSVGSGTGLTGGPITGSGTLSVDVGTTAGKIVQVDTGDKLPVIDGSALTNLNASNLASGTIAAARMPALTGDVTTSAGSVATTLAKIQGKTLTASSPTSGDFLKYNGSGWVNAALSSADLSNESDLLKASNMPANCSASQTLTFSSPTGTWVCSNIAIDAAAITSGTIADARLPNSAKYWQAATGGINYASGNVGIGTANPASLLDVIGSTRSQKFISDSTNVESVSGTYTPTNMVYQFDEYRGWGYNSADDAIYYAANSSVPVVFRADGKVGIGTTAPTSMLQLGSSGDFAFSSDDTHFSGILSSSNRSNSRQALYFNHDATKNYNDMYLGSAFELTDGVSAAAPTFKTAGSSSITPNILAIGYNGFRFLTSSPAAVGTSFTPTEVMRVTGGGVGIGTTTPTATLDVSGKVRSTASVSYDSSSTTLSNAQVSPSVFAPDISTTLAVQNGDIVKVDLACNLYNSSGGATYMRSEIASGSGSWLQVPNWITVATTQWSGGFSTGLFKASADGNLTFQGYWHVSAGTGYAVYCNIIALVIGR